MPLNGSDVASKPSGTTAVADTTIESAKYNSVIDDLYSILNTVRTIAKGYTGASTAQGAVDNFFQAGTTVNDDALLLVDPADATKKVRLDAGSVTAGNTRVLTAPDASTTLVGTDTTQTLSNKTLTSPIIESTDAGATAGPDLDLYRNSASPAASDILGRLLFNGEDSAGNKELYAYLRALIGDPTSASEDAALEAFTVAAGTLARRLVIGAGMYMDGATGGDKGAGTVNASLYDNTYRVANMVLASGTASAASTIDIDLSTYITAGFKRFELEMENVVLATDGASIYLTVSVNAGSTFVSSGYRYSGSELYGSTESIASSDSAARFIVATTVGNATDERGHVLIDVRAGASWCAAHWDGHLTSQAGNPLTTAGSGQVKQANVNALRIAASSGTVSASWWLRGYRDA